MAEEDARQRQTGVVYGWGWSASGQLGQHTPSDRLLRPTPITSLSGASHRIAMVAAGLAHSAAVSDTGELYTFGKSAHGRLGMGPAATEYGFAARVPPSLLPRRVVRVSCGGYHTAVITSAREVYCFGRNDRGQLGLGSVDPSAVWEPRKVDALSGRHAVLVACGGTHTLVAVEGGSVYAFGSNDRSQVLGGSGRSAVEPSPVLVISGQQQPAGRDGGDVDGGRPSLFESHVATALAAGSAHSAAVIAGTLLTWGANSKGQCGLGHFDSDVGRPTPVGGALSQHRVLAVDCGMEHTAAIDDRGRMYTWGSEEYSQGGRGTLAQIDSVAANAAGVGSMAVAVPALVKDALLGQRCVAVRCGSYHTIALTDTGDLFAWGLGDYGQLGNSTTSNLPTPYHIRGSLQGAKVSDVACGGRHTLVACSPAPIIRIPESTFAADWAKPLLRPSELSDVALVSSDGVEFPAHRIVLFSGSDPIRAAIGSGGANSKLVLDGIDSPTVAAVLRFIYSGTIAIGTEAAATAAASTTAAAEIALLSAADKLGLSQLSAALKEHIPRCTAPPDAPTRHEIPLENPESLHHMRGLQMRGYLDSAELSDVTLVLRDDDGAEVRFPVHRIVLSCRSDVFRTMIVGQFKEGTGSEISLPMHRPSAFGILLQYIYTDRADLTEDDAVEVLMMSNEYGLDSLKAQCEDFIHQSIDIDNVAWLFEISERNDARQLKAFCEYFMMNKLSEVALTEGFKNLSEDIKAMLTRGHQLAPESSSKDGKCTLQ